MKYYLKTAISSFLAFAIFIWTFGCTKTENKKAVEETIAPATLETSVTEEPTSAPIAVPTATAEPTPSPTAVPVEKILGTFIGVKDYKNVPREDVLNSENQIFQFEINGEIKELSVNCDENYTIQNKLMMDYDYLLEIDGTLVKSVELADKDEAAGKAENYTPGERTLKNFLKTATAPMGHTLYVYGGGWNFQDNGSSILATSAGVSPTWENFFNQEDENYNFKEDTYPTNSWNTFYYAGLDCSGYVGWTLYNTLYNENQWEDGFVMSSTKMAYTLADKYGLGEFVHPENSNYSEIAKSFKPGDIVSISGHVYIIIGACDDGSLVILHSSPSESVTGFKGGGVQLSALNPMDENNTNCEAYRLCEDYMNQYFPEWTERYPVVLSSASLFLNFSSETTGYFEWFEGDNGLTDPDNIQNMSAAEVLEELFVCAEDI